MRRIRVIELGALLIGAVTLLGAGCPLVPQIEDRVVELAVGGSATAPFDAVGVVNNHNETATVDLAAGFDLNQVLNDAGVDVADVKDIKLSGVSFRVTQPDPTTGRAIVNGQVTLRRGAGAEVPLVVNFNADVNSATEFQTATIDPAGVAVVNQILADYLAAVQAGTTPSNTVITYHVTGQSTPANVPTDFKWELKVDVSILGTIKVKMIG
jgi:hypothetical protein